MSRNYYRSQSGMYLLAAIAFVILLILMAGLVVGTGYRSGNRVLLQNHANITALAAMEGMVSSSALLPAGKINDALVRANEILNKNTLKGIGSPVDGAYDSGIGRLVLAGQPTDDNTGGEVEFGYWYQNKPRGVGPANNPCRALTATPEDLYPCFSTILPPSSKANAVHVKLKNRNNNPIFAPFMGVITPIEEDSYAIMVPRCTASLVDVSYSAVLESHKPCFGGSCYALGQGVYAAPISNIHPLNPTSPTASFFAFDTNYLVKSPYSCTDLQAPGAISDTTTLEGILSPIYNCNLQTSRINSNPNIHFQSDYELEETSLGDFMVDKYIEPQPLTRFLSAMNGSYRLIKKSSTPGDGSMLLGFNGDLPAQVPASGLTNDIDYLVQITNPDNIGTKNWSAGSYTVVAPEIYPNYLNENFLPRYSEDPIISGSNLVKAIFIAAATLSDPNECDAMAKKSIIIATDGFGTCSPDAPYEDESTPLTPSTPYKCVNEYARYLLQKTTLLNRIRNILLANKISLTVLIDGQAVGPHYLNISDATISPDNGTPFLTPEEARVLGVGTSGIPFFNATPKCPAGIACSDPVAFDNIGVPGYEFHDPLLTLGKLAFETGGLICPLMDRCAPSDYEDVGDPNGKRLRDSLRIDGTELRCSLYDISKTEQAARCAAQAAGGNPFALRQPCIAHRNPADTHAVCDAA